MHIYIYIHQIAVLDNRYTAILVYKDTTEITNLMMPSTFYVLLTVHPGMILVINQLDAQIVRQVG